MPNHYGHRRFTFVEDKLPAIAGMAKYMADKTGDEYLVGLWKSELPSSLVWYAECHQNSKYHMELPEVFSILHSPKPYIAPSWSPLRLDVAVKPGFASNMWYRGNTPESTIVDTSVSSVGENPFGRVRSGRIRIRGRVTTVSSNLAPLPCHRDDKLWFALEKGVITYYNLDCSPRDSTCIRGELLMLLISSIERPHSSLHREAHHCSDEEAHHCLKHYLPLLVAGDESSPDLELDGFESEADQHSDIVESGSNSLHSRRSSDAQSSNINNGDAFGLLVHPLPGTNDYVRVGVWLSMEEDGGGNALFEDAEEREIDIV
ncbi:hypothetical protein INS49_009360 [Diaporthe citri]|uniref:uncharacterized protein n=1 Tax=Diaporthe citri TaxID=83186 RepID=UPI001C7E8972|nr:uncharacterized protein INS49_009360 [Diaporthe citri]KAG6361136.1 hypothetical protein INS49_009360 [Diaporthe citri]